MNKKGATLLEMVVAILVISIASVILFAGFATVARVLGDANEIKNNSDTLLSYAEKTDDSILRSKVNSEEKSFPYKILADDGSTIQVNGNYRSLNVIGNEEVYLRTLRNEIKILVKDSDQYLNANAFAKRLNEICKKALEGTNTDFPSNNYLKDVFLQYHTKWSVFPKELLPSKLQQANHSEYYIKPCYPWDYEAQGDFFYTKGALLMFLSLDFSEINDTSKDDKITIIYDYEDSKGVWYYYEEDRFGVSFNFNNPRDTTNFIVDNQKVNVLGGNTNYTSWADLKAKILAKGSGWKVLDSNAEYTPENPDLFWRDL